MEDKKILIGVLDAQAGIWSYFLMECAFTNKPRFAVGLSLTLLLELMETDCYYWEIRLAITDGK